MTGSNKDEIDVQNSGLQQMQPNDEGTVMRSDEEKCSAPLFPLEKKTSVVELGHVGLPTALGLAELGCAVAGADSDPTKVEMIRNGHSASYELGIQEQLARYLGRDTFRPTDAVDAATCVSRLLFFCVGTRQKDNGQADLSQVEGLARSIAHNLNAYKSSIEMVVKTALR